MSIYDDLADIRNEFGSADASNTIFALVGMVIFTAAVVMILIFDITLTSKYGLALLVAGLAGVFLACMNVANYALMCASGIQKSNAIDSYTHQFLVKQGELTEKRHDELMRVLYK